MSNRTVEPYMFLGSVPCEVYSVMSLIFLASLLFMAPLDIENRFAWVFE